MDVTLEFSAEISDRTKDHLVYTVVHSHNLTCIVSH